MTWALVRPVSPPWRTQGHPWDPTASRKSWKTAEQVFVIQSDIIQLWENAIAKMKPSVDCVGDDVEFPTCTQSCKLYFAQCTKCKGSKCQCA